jgi:hypothetical protein
LLFRLLVLILALSSAIVMAGHDGCTTYAHFSSFVFLVGGNIMAAILEVAALYLQFAPAAAAPADDEESTVASDIDEEEGIGAAGIMLVALDLIVIDLLLSTMAATYSQANSNRGQIGACPGFTGQVLWAKILALAGCVFSTLVIFAKSVPLPFNVPLLGRR